MNNSIDNLINFLTSTRSPTSIALDEAIEEMKVEGKWFEDIEE